MLRREAVERSWAGAFLPTALALFEVKEKENCRVGGCVAAVGELVLVEGAVKMCWTEPAERFDENANNVSENNCQKQSVMEREHD